MNKEMKDLRVVFMGTPEFATVVLKELINNTNVVLVVTQPDKEVGRKKELMPSSVKKMALENNIDVFTPSKVRNEYEYIFNYEPDIIITCAYGQIIPKELLDYPKYKCVNVHASLLPLLRGGAPIHRAIINGFIETGITIMYMNEKMDEGDIISQSKIKIEEDDNVGTLHDKLTILGSKLLIETLPLIISGKINPIKQDSSKATYGYIIKRVDEHLDFNKTSLEVYNKIRGLYPFPSSYIILDDTEVKVLQAYIGKKTNERPSIITNVYKDGFAVSTLDREIVITKIKVSGKKEMLARDYVNGKKKENLIGKEIK